MSSPATAPAAEASPVDQQLRSVARGGLLNLLGAAVSGLANVGLVVLVTRGFSRHEAGLFFAATSVFLLAQTLSKLGTQTGLVYFLARFRALRTPQNIGPGLSVALVPVLVASALVALALYGFAPQIARLAVRGDPGDFPALIRLLAVFLLPAAIADTLLAASRGFATMRPTVAVDKVGRPALQVGFTVGAVLAGSSTALTLAWAGPFLPAAVLAALWWETLRGRRRVPRGSKALRDPALGRAFWRFTAPRALASMAQMALQRLDIVLVAALRGPADAAVYAAATRFLVVGQVGALAISTAVQPRLGEQLAREDRAGTARLYQTATSWLVLVLWPFYLLSAAFAPAILRIFGRSYTQGAGVVAVLAAASVVATGCGMVDMVLTMAGRTTWNLANALLALGLNVGLDLLLIPRLGILGAALGWAVAIVANNLVPLAQVAFVLKLHPFGRATLVAATLALLCFGLPTAVLRLLGGDGPLALVAASASGIGLYVGGLWRLRVPLSLGLLRDLRRASRRPTPTTVH